MKTLMIGHEGKHIEAK